MWLVYPEKFYLDFLNEKDPVDFVWNIALYLKYSFDVSGGASTLSALRRTHLWRKVQSDWMPQRDQMNAAFRPARRKICRLIAENS